MLADDADVSVLLPHHRDDSMRDTIFMSESKGDWRNNADGERTSVQAVQPKLGKIA